MGDNIIVLHTNNIWRWTEQVNDDFYKDLLPGPVSVESSVRYKACIGPQLKVRES
jgi:hypothetical protein